MPTTATYLLPYPAAGDPADVPTDMQELADRLEVVLPTVGASLVTALPGSPTDGQEVILVDSLTAPTYAWRLRYSTGISDANKWLFVGGDPAVSEVATSEGTTSATYTALATPGPIFVVARAGIYIVEIGAQVDVASGTGNLAAMSYDIGGTGAVDADSIAVGHNAAPWGYSAYKPKTKTLTAVTLTAKYRKTAGANTALFSSRFMRITPVRVA